MLIQSDARDIPLRSECVQLVVTSPPYWALRVYPHKDQIGLERTPQEYVAELVKVFREVRRVLRPDGVIFMCLGDTYATGAGKVGGRPGGGPRGEKWRGAGPYDQDRKKRCPRGPMTSPNRMPLPGLKPKDLIGIPWRAALALQEDGWWLRSDIIWEKPNPIPESAKDRVCRSHDYIFMLSKSRHYYWNRDAVREPLSDGPLGGRQMAEMSGKTAAPRRKDYHDGRLDRFSAGNVPKKPPLVGAHGSLAQDGQGMRMPGKWTAPGGRNVRSVWTIATEQYGGITLPCSLVDSRSAAFSSRAVLVTWYSIPSWAPALP